MNIKHWWSDNWHCKTVTVGKETCASHGLPCEWTRKCAMKIRWLIGWTVSRSSKRVQEASYTCTYKYHYLLPLGMLSVAKVEAFATVSMRSSLLWDSAQHQLVVLLREFRESVSIPSRCPKTSWHWMMVPTRFLEMSVTNYQLTLCNVLEEGRSSVISGWKFVDAETRMWPCWR